MPKLVINDITSGYASVDTLNSNFTAIETALENTLSLDGTTPNSMNAALDMNGYPIINQRATSGDVNFIWKGTWTTGTTYYKNNLIYASEGSLIGNGLICIADHTAGATLDGDVAYWDIYVEKGATVGGLSGPASSTNNYLAQWNGTSGTILKEGVPIGSGGVQAYSTNLAALTAFTTDTDATLAANSDTRLATQKATKTYVDNVVVSATTATPDTAADYYIFEDATDNTQKKALLSTLSTPTVKVSANDTTPGYLNGKLVAGSNVTLTEGSDGANETLTIAATGVSADVGTSIGAFIVVHVYGNSPGSDSYPTVGNTYSPTTGTWRLNYQTPGGGSFDFDNYKTFQRIL